MDLSILIVNNNRPEFLKNCLRSIYSQTRKFQMRVAVMHNGGENGNPELENSFGQVNFISGKQKRGFSANQNELLNTFSQDSRYCLLLNEDTVVMPGALEKMLQFMDDHSEAACAGAQLVFPDLRPQLSGGSFPSFLKEIFRFSGLGKIILPQRVKIILGKYFSRLLPQECRQYLKSFYSRQPYERMDYISGCAMMMRSRAIRDIGLFDQGYIMYAEDLDWCRRAASRGWKNYLVTEARVIHYLNQARPAQVMLWYEQSMLKYFKKYNYSGMGIVICRIIIAFICLLKIAYYYLWRSKEPVKASRQILEFMLCLR